MWHTQNASYSIVAVYYNIIHLRCVRHVITNRKNEAKQGERARLTFENASAHSSINNTHTETRDAARIGWKQAADDDTNCLFRSTTRWTTARLHHSCYMPKKTQVCAVFIWSLHAFFYTEPPQKGVLLFIRVYVVLRSLVSKVMTTGFGAAAKRLWFYMND